MYKYIYLYIYIVNRKLYKYVIVYNGLSNINDQYLLLLLLLLHVSRKCRNIEYV